MCVLIHYYSSIIKIYVWSVVMLCMCCDWIWFAAHMRLTSWTKWKNIFRFYGRNLWLGLKWTQRKRNRFFCFVNQLANDATSIDIIRYFLLTCFRCNFVCFFSLLSRQRDCLCLHPILVTIKFIIIVFHCCKNANCSFLLSIWCFFFVCLFFH